MPFGGLCQGIPQVRNMICQQTQTPESCVGNVPQSHMTRAQSHILIIIRTINVCKSNSNGQTQLHEVEKIKHILWGKKLR